MEHPVVCFMEHPVVSFMEHPVVSFMEHPVVSFMEHPVVPFMEHPVVCFRGRECFKPPFYRFKIMKRLQGRLPSQCEDSPRLS